jgi:hypothetical protein
VEFDTDPGASEVLKKHPVLVFAVNSAGLLTVGIMPHLTLTTTAPTPKVATEATNKVTAKTWQHVGFGIELVDAADKVDIYFRAAGHNVEDKVTSDADAFFHQFSVGKTIENWIGTHVAD